MTQTFQSWYDSELSRKLEANDTEAYVAIRPKVEKWRMYLDNWAQRERIQFEGIEDEWDFFKLKNLLRGLSDHEDPATPWQWLAWLAWTPIELVMMHDQISDKNESQQFSAWTRVQIGNETYITTDENGENLTFKDGNNSEVTLSQLTSQSWLNDKVKVSSNDTTEWQLNSKVSAWSWIKKEIKNPWANEELEIDIDLNDSTIFTTAREQWKVPRLDSDWTLDSLITDERIKDVTYILWTGADGDVTISSDTTLVRDMYYKSLTIESWATLFPNGYKIYCTGDVLNNGTISFTGNDWQDGTDAVGNSETPWVWWEAWQPLNAWTLNASVTSWRGADWRVNNWPATQPWSGENADPTYDSNNGAWGWEWGWATWWDWWVLNNGWSATQWSNMFLLRNPLNLLASFAHIASFWWLWSANQFKPTAWAWWWWAWVVWDDWVSGWWWWAWTPWGIIWIACDRFTNNGTVDVSWWNGWNAWNSAFRVNDNLSSRAWGSWGWAWGNGWTVLVYFVQSASTTGYVISWWNWWNWAVWVQQWSFTAGRWWDWADWNDWTRATKDIDTSFTV